MRQLPRSVRAPAAALQGHAAAVAASGSVAGALQRTGTLQGQDQERCSVQGHQGALQRTGALQGQE